MLRFHPTAALACAVFFGCAGAGPAHAAASAQASLTGIQIQLTDLAPDDGIAPSLTYLSGYTVASAYTDPLNGVYTRPHPEVNVLNGDWSYVAFATHAATVALGGMNAAAQTSATDLAASSATTGGKAIGSVNANVASDGHGSFGFSLSPYSSFTITALARIEASSDGKSVGLLGWENSSAFAYAGMSVTSSEGPVYPDPNEQRSEIQLTVPAFVGSSLSDSRQLTLTFANTTGEVIHGSLALGVWAESATPVPEPSTLVMGALGLGLAACWRRRAAARG